VFLNLVPSGDSEVATAFANKGGNVGSREEDQSDWEVFYESDIEAVLTAELDVGALEEVKCSSIESTLLGDSKQKTAFETVDEIHGGLGIIGRQGSGQDVFSVGLGFELGKNHSMVNVEPARREQSGNLSLSAMTANDSDCGAFMSKRWRGS
jgi:hypothetical protein